jgi:hypothetical protein
MIKILTLSSILMLLFSCNAGRESGLAAIEVAMPGFTAVTVRNFTGMDGCNYVLDVNDSLRYEPVDLADSLKQDSLRLWIRYIAVKGHMSICMMGPAIKITEARYCKK